MAFPGQRFVVNLDDDDELTPNVDNIPSSPPSPPSSALIGEIHERAPSAAVPPAPKPPSGSGFPEHKKRFQRSSFKQRRANQQQQQQQQQSSAPTVDDEKKSIDEQNRRQLASMSNAEINEEREELISSLDPGLLERFLRRAKIDDAPQDTPAEDKPELQKSTAKPAKSVSFDVPEPPKQAPPPAAEPKTTSSTVKDDLPPPNLPDDLHPASEIPSFHFPTPPQPPSSSSSSDQTLVPNLDPSSPSFLADLQSHYFPNIQHDPSALSWLQPPSSDPEDPAAATSAYHPASQADAVHPAAIRFSLVGTVLSPNTSLSLPTSLGLHHHGNDPQAAGYTIPELAILGRSSFPAQRCIAWQVLGRILFRLGRGEFGERGSTLVEGLWFVIEKEGSIALMLAEADGASSSTSSSSASASDSASAPAGLVKGAGIGRHASAAAWAVEGVWLWQKGGGGDRGILKEGVIRPR